MVTASDDKSIRIWDLEKRSELMSFFHEAAVTDFEFTPSSEYIVAGDENGNILVWSTDSGDQVLAKTLGEGKIQKIKISPDGVLTAAGNNKGDVCVWQIIEGEELLCFSVQEAIWDIEFSGSDKIFVGSSDTFVHIWEINSKSEYGRIRNGGLVLSLDLSADNKVLAMSTTSGTSRFSIWKKKDIIQEACKRIPRQLTDTEWSTYFGDIAYSPYCLDFLIKNDDVSGK